MSLVAIGVNNRTMPLDQFERFSINSDQLPKALEDISGRKHVSESVVLSTCNRTEVYVYAEKFHGAYQDVRDFLAETAQIPPEAFSDHLYAHHDDDAIHHLFTVTCGLDSAVIGESEIQHQVKVAWEHAREEGHCGTVINSVFRSTLEAGKRIRSETGISKETPSVSQVAVAMANDRGDLSEQNILVLGAGEMAQGVLAQLTKLDAKKVTLSNRSLVRAEALADTNNARAVPLERLSEELVKADVFFTSTGSSSLMLDHDYLVDVMEQRRNRPLLVVDIAIPRDIDPTAEQIAGISLLDMDDLREYANRARTSQEKEILIAKKLITEEVSHYLEQLSARQVAPLVAGFRNSVEEIRLAELKRFESRLSSLNEEEREAVDLLTKRLLGKILHSPTITINEAADSPRGERLAEALQELFDL
ncbi:MAG: glutamyl-tRNA reductase [Acidimicrobiales bacterium]|nr:glutamyl-tRNA reductase [Acidimicrobiales bacterium]MDG1846464.1 glutamyl-tRNA reductase [Acidimicrobiales bacterium]